jgi:3-oxoacyl-[acyl-carrier protein] reductase
MDLGIRGRKAIVCAASKGLGRACALSLAREGVDVVITARTAADLEQTAADIRAAAGVRVTPVACDITTPEGRQAALAACPQPDILVNNAGGPPAGDWREFDLAAWQKAVNANMLTPIELIRATVDGMMERRFGRIVNITSAAVKAPIDILALSNGARTGLTGFVAGVARKTVANNVTINNLLPGLFGTDTMVSRIEAAARVNQVSVEEAKAARLKTIPAGRFGIPAEFGDACAFLCSAQMGFVTGLNFLIDGGAYPGTF